jgi:hypothetical protein
VPALRLLGPVPCRSRVNLGCVDQLREADAKRIGDLAKGLVRGIAGPSLQATDMRCVQAAQVREVFLAQTRLPAVLLDRCAQAPKALGAWFQLSPRRQIPVLESLHCVPWPQQPPGNAFSATEPRRCIECRVFRLLSAKRPGSPSDCLTELNRWFRNRAQALSMFRRTTDVQKILMDVDRRQCVLRGA